RGDAMSIISPALAANASKANARASGGRCLAPLPLDRFLEHEDGDEESGEHHPPCIPEARICIARLRNDEARDERKKTAKIAGAEMIRDRQGRIADMRREHFRQQRSDGAISEPRKRAQPQQRKKDDDDTQRARNLLFETVAHRLEGGLEKRGILARDSAATDVNLDAIKAAIARRHLVRHAQPGELAKGLAAGSGLLLGEGV